MTNKAVMRVSDNGSKIWSVDELPHREDGPAIERPDGSKEWWLNHQRHCENGPAVITPSGKAQYWLRDTKLDEKIVMDETKRAEWLAKNNT